MFQIVRMLLLIKRPRRKANQYGLITKSSITTKRFISILVYNLQLVFMINRGLQFFISSLSPFLKRILRILDVQLSSNISLFQSLLNSLVRVFIITRVSIDLAFFDSSLYSSQVILSSLRALPLKARLIAKLVSNRVISQIIYSTIKSGICLYRLQSTLCLRARSKSFRAYSFMQKSIIIQSILSRLECHSLFMSLSVLTSQVFAYLTR